MGLFSIRVWIGELLLSLSCDRLLRVGKSGEFLVWLSVAKLFILYEMTYLYDLFRLAMMKEGGKTTFIIPSDLGYTDAAQVRVLSSHQVQH